VAFALALAAVLVAVVGIVFFTGRGKAGSVASPIESIAILPFVDDAADSDAEYLNDKIAESLINSLSQIPNLSVKARSSVFRYKGKEIDPKKVASELGVQANFLTSPMRHGERESFRNRDN
jgi:TolB-like protein